MSQVEVQGNSSLVNTNNLCYFPSFDEPCDQCSKHGRLCGPKLSTREDRSHPPIELGATRQAACENVSTTEPLLSQILKALKHQPDVIPRLRAELCSEEFGALYPTTSKESTGDSPADPYPITSTGEDNDTPMTSTSLPDFSHSVVMAPLLPPFGESSRCLIQPMSPPQYALYEDSNETVNNSSGSNAAPSHRLPLSNSSLSQNHKIKV